MATLALMILGLALSPLLKVKLLPDRALPSVTVYFNYKGANAVVVDSEVTSRLEGIFSNLGGLVNMRSRTADGSGDIILEMEKEADMDAVRFEVSMLIRQVFPELPQGVGYPQIQVSRPDKEERVEQLMHLIEQAVRNEKAIVIAFARKLLNKNIKVPSKAIEEIKEEMREIVTANEILNNATEVNKVKGKNYTKYSPMLIKRQFW
jgi:hypothetical protein